MQIIVTENFNLTELHNYIPTALEEVMKNAESYYDASERTPYWTGATQDSKRHEVQSKIAKLSYNTDYASDIYQDIHRNFSKTHNANAQARWIEDPSIFDQLAKDLADEMKKGGSK
jgi:hypothetical protein